MELNDAAKQALLSALNLSETQVTTLNESAAEQAPEAAKAVIEDLNKVAGEKYLALKLNDPKWVDDLDVVKKREGKIYGTLRETLKSVGKLSKDLVYDEEGNKRPVREIVEAFKDSIVESTGKKTPEEIIKIQEEHAAKLRAAEARESSLISQLEEKEKAFTEKLQSFKIQEMIKGTFAQIENLKHSPEDAALLFQNKLQGFNSSLTEAEQLQFLTPDGRALEVGNEVVKDPVQFINHFANTWGWIEKKEDPKPPTPAKVPFPNGNGNPAPRPLTPAELRQRENEAWLKAQKAK